MPTRWQLWSEDADERRAFADLATTLRLPATPVGPPNRWRQVARIDLGGRAYFLKRFARTQWKNRLAFAATAPRAHDDAERERLVAGALRAAGLEAPRPVAAGRDGAASFLVLAALPGTSCRELLAAGQVDAALARTVAGHCGRLLARGFHLPDLSADHVYARRDGPDWRLAVLDLHNGRLAPPGPPPRRLARRVLRRFQHSVRSLPVGWPVALRFAVRLLRAAGLRAADRRAALAALPPFATAARYERPGRSSAYATRNPRRGEREVALLQRVWPGRAGETVLDLPCGAGRLRPFLAARSHAVVQADGAMAMLREARAGAPAGGHLVQADALAMPFADGALDGVVLFRFLHHLDGQAQACAIAEACRVARRFVVVSFFHPCSLHHLRRQFRRALGAPPTRFATTLGRLASRFARHGFHRTAHAADRPFARDLWLAAFERAAGEAT